MEDVKDLNESRSHKWLFEISFSCSEKYDQFINWLGTEFYFFQQEHIDYLTIYFPNGKIKVEKEKVGRHTLVSKITLMSKCKEFGLKIRMNLSEFLDHIEKYHKLKQNVVEVHEVVNTKS